MSWEVPRQREKVPSVSRPLDVHFLLIVSHSIHILLRCAVNKLELGTVFVIINNPRYPFNVFVGDIRILEGKIGPHCEEYLSRPVMASVLNYAVHECVRILFMVSQLILEKTSHVVVVLLIDPQINSAIALVHGMRDVSEHAGERAVLRSIQALKGRLPQKLESLLFLSLSLLSIVNSAEKERLKSEFLIKFRRRRRVAEGVQKPGDLGRLDPHFLGEEFMASHHVGNQLLRSGTGFIAGAPASKQELKTTFLIEVAHFLLLLYCALAPPSTEEKDLSLAELARSIGLESSDDGCEDGTHTSGVVFFGCLLEAYVVVRMAD